MWRFRWKIVVCVFWYRFVGRLNNFVCGTVNFLKVLLRG